MEYTIDAKGIYTAEEFYSLLGEYISIPDYFGNNLDGLNDLLTDINKETIITVINLEDMESVMPKFVRGIKRLSENINKENLKVKLYIK